MRHVSVFLQETIAGLELRDGDVVVDGTLGDGGHTEAMFATGRDIEVIGLDLDSAAIARSQNRLAPHVNHMTYVNDSFRNLTSILEKLHVSSVSKVLLDLGLSSGQIDPPAGGSGRGFSFQRDEPLIMTFGNGDDGKITARDVVNDWSQETLATIIRGFGEERFSGRIARGIVEAREVAPIETTGQLVDIILSVTPSFYAKGKIHPATRTFQAIRIAVNDELEALKAGLSGAWQVLSPGGRIAVISFHSLEDRIAKQYFRSLAADDTGLIITKKPLIATEAEVKENPRSRSAKLRIIEKKLV